MALVEVGVQVLPVDGRERVTQQRRAEAFALLCRVDAEEGEMPGRDAERDGDEGYLLTATARAGDSSCPASTSGGSPAIARGPPTVAIPERSASACL